MDILVSIFLGAMCGMGVGSAGLFVTYLVLAKGMEQIIAQGTNFVFFLSAALCALPVHLKKRSISLKRVIMIALPAAVFSVIGSYVANFIPGENLRGMFGVLLCTAGALSAVRCVREFVRQRKNKKSEKIEKNT